MAHCGATAPVTGDRGLPPHADPPRDRAAGWRAAAAHRAVGGARGDVRFMLAPAARAAGAGLAVDDGGDTDDDDGGGVAPPPPPPPRPASPPRRAPPPPPPTPQLPAHLAPRLTRAPPPTLDASESSLLLAAAARAGGARALLAAKVAADKAARPWRLVTEHETAAAAAALAAALAPGPAALLVLVDTSASVTPDDYAAGTAFAAAAAAAVAAACGGSTAGASMGVVQFSHDARVELPLQPADADTLTARLASLRRVNGGTNAAAALRAAHTMLGEWAARVVADAAAVDATAAPPEPRTAVLLLSDGAFSDGGVGAVDEVDRAASALGAAGVVVAAGASGRSHDYRGGGAALRRVVAAARGAGAEALFVALRTVDERYYGGEW